jgi:hypothetical protein
MTPDLNEVVGEAEADESVVGLVLIGSYASGRPDAESDVDVLWVEREGPRRRKHHRGRIELIPTTLARIQEPTDWFKPALGTGRVILDKTGEVAAAVAAAATVDRDTTAERLDDYLNSFYRSLKAWRRGNELAGRIEGMASLRSLAEFLHALDGRRAPYPSAYPGTLGELEPLIVDVARTTDPVRQQELQARVEKLARERGFASVYADWDGEIERAMKFRF